MFDWFTAEYHVIDDKMLQSKLVISLYSMNFCEFARNTVVVDINFKNMNFKNLTKILLILTMFIQRADNLAKLTGWRIVLTSANREQKVQ